MNTADFVAAIRALINTVNAAVQSRAALVAQVASQQQQIASLQSQLAAAQSAAGTTTPDEDQAFADLTAAVNQLNA